MERLHHLFRQTAGSQAGNEQHLFLFRLKFAQLNQSSHSKQVTSNAAVALQTQLIIKSRRQTARVRKISGVLKLQIVS